MQYPMAVKLLSNPKKLRGGTDLLYHRAMFGGDRVSHAGFKSYREACRRAHDDILFTYWSKNGFFSPGRGDTLDR